VREASITTFNKKADHSKSREELIENICAGIEQRSLKTRDLKAVDPSITANNVAISALECIPVFRWSASGASRMQSGL
jgi:hypothetical protein